MNGGNKEIASSLCKKTKVNNLLQAVNSAVLRHWHDPSLSGTIQHRWMRQKKNVMPEIAWSQLRRRFTPGFENILQEGVNEGWYDMNRPLDA